VVNLDDTLASLVAEVGDDHVQRLRGAPFDSGRAQRLFDALTGQRELTPPPAPHAPEISRPPADVEPAVSDSAPDDGEDHADDFFEIDDGSFAGAIEEDESGSELVIEDGIVLESVDELASQIEQLASQADAMRTVLTDDGNDESIEGFFAGDERADGIIELDDSDDGEDDTGTVQVNLPEEHEAPTPDREKSLRSSVKKLFRK